jgi:hypothetical protein
VLEPVHMLHLNFVLLSILLILPNLCSSSSSKLSTNHCSQFEKLIQHVCKIVWRQHPWWLIAISFRVEKISGISKGKRDFSLQLRLKTFWLIEWSFRDFIKDSGRRLESRGTRTYYIGVFEGLWQYLGIGSSWRRLGSRTVEKDQ